MSRIIESKVICRQPGRYLAWPTAARSPQGVLYAVFSGDRDAHVCPFGKNWIIRSEDEGHSWSAPELVNDTPLDDRDAGLCVCPDGTLVMTWFTSWYQDYHHLWQAYIQRRGGEYRQHSWESWQHRIAVVTDADISHWAAAYKRDSADQRQIRRMGYWTRRSRDGGRTWDDPTPSPVSAPHGPAVMANGDLIYVGMLGHHREDGVDNIKVAHSSDQGRTWTVLAGIDSYPPYNGPLPDGNARLVEPHVAAARSGKLVGLARMEQTHAPGGPTCHPLWQFDSYDNGRTWSAPRPTPVIGKPPHLCVLASGEILVTYGMRDAPYGQRACISRDEGQTWEQADEIVLRDDAPDSDLGYPATAECADGTLVSLYYQIEKPGAKPCLMMTRFARE